MNIHLKALDSAGDLIFESSVVVDAPALVAVSQPRAELARAKGRDFTEGAVPFFASELLNAAQRGVTEDELHAQALTLADAKGDARIPASLVNLMAPVWQLGTHYASMARISSGM